MIPTFTRSYTAALAVAGYRIVKFAAPTVDSSVATAAAETDEGFGVSDSLGAEAGQMLDVHLGGLVSLQLGATVQAGDRITADSDGKGVTAAASAGSTVFVVGIANEPGVEDDIIDVIWAPGVLHEAAA